MLRNIGRFLDELSQRVGRLHDAADANDLEALRTITDQLKRAADGQGARPITHAARQRGAAAAARDELGAIEQHLKELISLCRRATAAASSNAPRF